MKNTLKMFVSCIILVVPFAAIADTYVTAIGYGATYADAVSSAKYQLKGMYPDVESVGVGDCGSSSVGAPWQCTAYGAIPGGSCQVASVTGYGVSKREAYEAALSLWGNYYSTQPGVSCEPASVGPPWQCVATGCAN